MKLEYVGYVGFKRLALMALCSVFTLGALGGFSTANAAADGWKWGYVDLQRAIRVVDKGKRAYDDLMAMKDARQKELQTEEGSLRTEGESLKKQENTLSDDAKRRKAMEFGQKQMEFQRKVEKYENELMKAQNEYAKDILLEMEKILEDLGKTEGYDAIFDRSTANLVYARQGNDLTDEVVRRYNKRFPISKSSKTKK